MITTTERLAMKKEIIQRLLTINDESLLEKVNDLLPIANDTQAKKDISKAEMLSIRKGIFDATTGKLHLHDKAKTVYGRWL